MANWDKRWMDMALLVSTWSKDKSRKTGCVIVDDRNVVVSLGWNGFPRGVDDSVEDRHERPDKYLWTAHAEQNAVANAAANGHSTRGCTLYIPWYPCADCACGIIQAGLTRVVCSEPDWDDETYSDSFRITRTMLAEAGVKVDYVDWIESPQRKP